MKGKHKDCKGQRTMKSAVMLCLLAMTREPLLLKSQYDSLNKTRTISTPVDVLCRWGKSRWASPQD